MSYSVSFIGTTDKVIEALNETSQQLTDQSKVEFDAILPGLIAMVEGNRNPGQALVKLEANGHRSGEYGSCTVSVSAIWGALV